jgi:hypothetical protein
MEVVVFGFELDPDIWADYLRGIAKKLSEFCFDFQTPADKVTRRIIGELTP